MHFISLAAVEIPEITENEDQNKVVKQIIQELKAQLAQDDENIVIKCMIERYSMLTTEFAREVDSAVEEVMYPYCVNMENRTYLEFEDHSDELRDSYENEKSDCIRLPDGRIIPFASYVPWNRFIIKDGKVYQKCAGQLRHAKRTKKAKKLKVLPSYPLKKRFKSLDDYAEYFGTPFDEEQQKYGYWSNPNAMWDWYSIGGRWPDMFLVKDTCKEFSLGEGNWDNMNEGYEAPEGYLWVCAARKKDIEWQQMQNWKRDKLANLFLKLKKMFENGQVDEGFTGVITDSGIMQYNTEIYHHGDSLDMFLASRGYPSEWKYPLVIHDFVSREGWKSEYDVEGYDWNKQIDEFVDSLSDDAVLVGVDYHL